MKNKTAAYSFLLTRHFALLFALCLVSISVFSQNKRQELESQKKKIEAEIAYTNRLLSENRESKNVSLRQLRLLRNKIVKRQKLLDAMSDEIGLMNENISTNQKEIKRLEEELALLKKSYGKMVYNTFKNRNSLNRLMFIFSSKDFNQAFKRTLYYKQYAKHRQLQAKEIVATKDSIDLKNRQLEQQKAEKDKLRQKENAEKEKLEKEKQQQNQTVQNLSKKEKQLKKKLREREKAAKKLQNDIQKIIEEEIRLSAKKAGKSEKEIKKSVSYSLTPAELKLSNDFESNKGKLPWPLEKGIISEYFGEHAYPGLRMVKTHNNGLNLLTEKGQDARSIFSGVVTNIMSIPNLKNVVMIRHGEYLTVYSNLEEVYVKEGEKINTKQKIGKIYTDTESGDTEMHFELWKGKSRQDPYLWLAK